MKQNYLAWNVDIADFYKYTSDVDRLKFLLNFAVLAPSSHNSQPWFFRISRKKIKIFLEKDRLLPIGDTNNRQAIISLGCAAQNICTAADYYGYRAEISFAGKDSLIAEIFFEECGEVEKENDNHLIFSIPRRITNRNEYSANPLPEELTEFVKNSETENMEIHIVTDKDIKNNLADIAIEAGITAMENPEFRLELSHHVKNNLTKSFLGMPCFGLGLPTPVSFVAPWMIRFFNMNRIGRKKDSTLLKKSTPAFLIISTEGDDPESWFNTGLAYQKIALFSNNLEIYTSPWAAPIQITNFYKKMQPLLETSFRSQLFSRIGACEKTVKHSPRLLLNDIIRQ